MARKTCPACKHLNGGSATRCSSCDQPFDAASVVAPGRPKTRQCPGCTAEVPKVLEICGCGHAFADVRKVREHLEEQVRVGWSYMVLGVLGLAGLIALTIAMAGTIVLAWPGAVFLFVKGLTTRGDAKAALAEIRGATAKLPTASVVR